MERLWAPWRMEYILNCRQPGCFLCDICQDNRDAANLVLARGEQCFLLMNRYPYNNGHLMVAPYRHVDSLVEMTEPERLEMMNLAALACDRVKTLMRADGFNVGFNIGSAAGAGLKDHIHLHIVPRWQGDTNFMPVLADVKVIPQPLAELWQKLNAAIGPIKSGVG